MVGIPSALFFLIVFIVIIAASAIKIVREYERGVIFRLGRLIGAKGPGMSFIEDTVLDAINYLAITLVWLRQVGSAAIDQASTLLSAVPETEEAAPSADEQPAKKNWFNELLRK